MLTLLDKRGHGVGPSTVLALLLLGSAPTKAYFCCYGFGDGLAPPWSQRFALFKEERDGDISIVQMCFFVCCCASLNIEELCVSLDQVPVLLSRPLAMPVRLLVIDSVVALFQSEFDNNAKDLAKRTEWFLKLSSKLQQYAHDYDIDLLVTNQVVDGTDVGSKVVEDGNVSFLGKVVVGAAGNVGPENCSIEGPIKQSPCVDIRKHR
ncbi:hypothetical protein L7F22_060932 [Adiantum nelumboides]|nr:hypothetical protein [Adiantum nelumboides]